MVAIAVTNYTEVVALQKDGQGSINGATVVDRETGQRIAVKAKGVINATGPFTDTLRLMDDPKASKIVVPSSGVHIVLPSYYSPTTMGLLEPQTSDGRVIFLLPWENYTVAGTTDTPVEVSDRPAPLETEVQWILHELKHYLSKDVNVERGDVLAAWSGIRCPSPPSSSPPPRRRLAHPVPRPLVKDPGAKNTESLVRNHMIHVSDSKLLTIAGGKWTTYRQCALPFLSLRSILSTLPLPSPSLFISRFLLLGLVCVGWLRRRSTKPLASMVSPLPSPSVRRRVRLSHPLSFLSPSSSPLGVYILGGEHYSPSMYVKLIQRFGIDREVAEHLAKRFPHPHPHPSSLLLPISSSFALPFFTYLRLATVTALLRWQS